MMDLPLRLLDSDGDRSDDSDGNGSDGGVRVSDEVLGESMAIYSFPTLDQLKNGDGSRIEMELKPKMGGDKISQERIAKVRSGQLTFWTDG